MTKEIDVFLTLVLTFKCTARCDICCFNSSPKINEMMPIEDSKDYINQATEIPEIKNIGISGGEPFIFFDVLKDIISYAKASGFQTMSMTNCFWAGSKDVALKKLKELAEAGLDRIGISADEFHQKYVSRERVKNCLYAAQELGIPIGLARVYTKTSKNLKELLSEYNIEEGEYVYRDEKKYFLSGRKLHESIGDKIIVGEQPIIPEGRALCIPRSELPLKSYKDFLQFRCPALLKVPIIYPNGDVYGCCSVTGFLNALYLGNAKEDKLSFLLEKGKADPFCEFIKVQGPAKMVKILKEKNVSLPEEYTDLCHICKEICDEKNRESVDAVIRNRYFETLLLRELMGDKDKK